MATTTGLEDKTQVLVPSVKWAQRLDKVYLTIDVEDIDPKPLIEFDNASLHFKAKGGHDNKTYEVHLPFYDEVDPKKSKELITGRHMFFTIYKKKTGPFWPRLLKPAGKVHFLKVDFNRWRDEDDSEEDVENDRSLEDMMRQMSSGTTDLPDMDDLNAPADSDDSDDEELPDLEETDTK